MRVYHMEKSGVIFKPIGITLDRAVILCMDQFSLHPDQKAANYERILSQSSATIILVIYLFLLLPPTPQHYCIWPMLYSRHLYMVGWEAKGFKYQAFAYDVRSFCLYADDTVLNRKQLIRGHLAFSDIILLAITMRPNTFI